MTNKKLDVSDSGEYSVSQAMAYLGVRQKITIKKWAKEGKLPFLKRQVGPAVWMMFTGKALKEIKRQMVSNPNNGASYFRKPKK